MKTILLPTDFSNTSKNTIKYAESLLSGITCKVILFNSFLGRDKDIPIFNILEESQREESQILLKKLEKYFSQKEIDDFHLEERAIRGNFIDVLNRLVGKESIDLVIMGQKGVSNSPESIFGKNTLGVLKKFKIPLLIVPDDYTYKKPKDIMLVLENHEALNKKELHVLKWLAKIHDSNISLISISQKEYVSVDPEGFHIQQPHGVPTNQSFLHRINKIFALKQGNDFSRYVQSDQYDLVAVTASIDEIKDHITNHHFESVLSGRNKFPMLIIPV